jgi:hypothetical protein
MATVLEEYTTKEQSSVVHFLWATGLNAKDVHNEMFPVYGGMCLSCKQIHNWLKKLSQGCSKVTDDAQCSDYTRLFPWFSIQHNV